MWYDTKNIQSVYERAYIERPFMCKFRVDTKSTYIDPACPQPFTNEKPPNLIRNGDLRSQIALFLFHNL